MALGRDSLAVSAPPGQFQPGAVVGSRFRLDALLSQDSVSQTFRATDAKSLATIYGEIDRLETH